jgi:hypothetical protein
MGWLSVIAELLFPFPARAGLSSLSIGFFARLTYSSLAIYKSKITQVGVIPLA